MEISIGGLLFLALFAFYLWNEHNKQVLEGKRRELEQQKEIERLKSAQNQSVSAPPERIYTEKILEKETVVIFRDPPAQRHTKRKSETKALPAATQFVKVIFNPDDDKSYDYLLGDHYNIKVGDFVKVWTSKGKSKIVQVIYISSYGEVSAYAKTAIEGKVRRPKWWN